MIDNKTKNKYIKNSTDNKPKRDRQKSAPLTIRENTKDRLVNYIESQKPRPLLIDYVSELIEAELDRKGAPK